jgi:hypothetical protein
MRESAGKEMDRLTKEGWDWLKGRSVFEFFRNGDLKQEGCMQGRA